jgi:small conductance mechanosensitive channel
LFDHCRLEDLLKGSNKKFRNEGEKRMHVEDFFVSQGSTFLGVEWSTIISIIIIVVVAIVLERVVTRYLKRFTKRVHLEPNVANGMALTFRLLILIGAIASLVRLGGLPSEWFVAFSALGGAAVGFASTQTIGNSIAGLYLLTTRPFKAGDYVRLGTVEGIVQEITINYTKILTMGYNVVSISNLQVMSRDMTNFSYESEEHEALYCYTFEIGFDHSVSADKTAEIFDGVFERYNKTLPKKLSYMLTRSGAFERVYMIYLYVKLPEDIFVYRPQIAEEVFKRWDMAKTK